MSISRLSRSFSRPAPRLALRGFSFLSVLLMCGLIAAFNLAAQAQTASGVFYYGADGKRISLPPSSKWLGVQLGTNADAGQVESRVRTLSPQSIEGVQRYRKRGLVIFALKSADGVAARSNLAVRVSATEGVNAVVRTFGEESQPMVEINQFVVRFKPGVSAQSVVQLLASVNAVIIKSLGDYAPNGFLARLKDGAGTHSIDAANALYESGQTVWAQPNFIRPKQALEATPRVAPPNDPLFGDQWHLSNTGQSGGTPGADIHALQAWDITRGTSSIIIAVIDTGIDIAHEDLRTKLVPGIDVVDDDSDPSPEPFYDGSPAEEDHGTACAGLAAAATSNGLGVAGAAPNCSLMPIRALAPGQTDANFADATYFAVRNGASVISNSYGPNAAFADISAVEQAAIHYAVTSGRGGKGCVVLFAAGNSAGSGQSADNDGYASNPDVISVGASTNFDKRASYSEPGNSVDIAAPGGDIGDNLGTLYITTTDRTGTPGYSPANYANDFNGTSAATPIAAGVAGLILSLKPDLTTTQVQAIMQSTADKVGDMPYDSAGRNVDFGFGRVNAYNALLEVRKQIFTVSGRVTNAAGAAVAGVVIQARIANSDGSFGPLKASTVTNSNGQYTFSNLSGGPTLIVASKLNFAFRTTEATPKPFYTVNITANLKDRDFLASGSPVVTLEEPPADSTVPRPFPALPTPQPSATPLASTFTPLIASTTNDFDVTKMNFFYHFPDQFKTNQPGRAIPDNDLTGIPSDFTFDGAGTVGDAIVSINISHTFISDLVITLTAPDGTVKTFFNREDGETVNLVRSFTIPFTSAPVAGKWTVRVSDQAADDTGTFNSCTLTLRPTRVAIATATQVTQGKWRSAWNTRNVARGVYVVGATAVAYSGNPTDENANVTVSAPRATLSGTITTSTGAPLQNALVQATVSGTSTTLPAVRTDSNGVFRFDQVAPDTYVITPTLESTVFDPTSRTVTIGGTNISTLNFVATVQDVVKPTISISSPRNYGVFRFSVPSASGTVSDDRSGVKSVVGVLFREAQGTRPAGFYNGTNFSETTYSPTSTTQNRLATLSGTGLTRTWNLPFPRLETGRYFFVATATDNVGNKASAPRIRFDVDVTAPAISVTNPVEGRSYTSAPQANGLATDVGTGVRSVTVLLFSYGNSSNNPPMGYFNGTTFTTTYDAKTQQRPATLTRNGDVTNWSLTLPVLKPGRYYVRPRAIDVAGNFRYAAAVTFTITAAGAPTAASPVQFSSASAAGSEVRLNFSGSLDKAAATNAANYSVTVNGQAADVSSASLSANTVVLRLSSSVSSGTQVSASWSGLTDANGRSVKPGQATTTAR